MSRARVVAGSEVAWTAGTALLAGLCSVLVLRLWHLQPSIPISGYNGDATLNNAVIKGVLEHGWYETNSDLAAPMGQHLYDFSAFSADSLQIACLGLLGVVLGGWGRALNAYLLLSFPLIAAIAFVCLRRLGSSRPVSAMAAILFAFMPYHFIRGLSGHLFLATYFSVPLGALLALRALLGTPLFARRQTGTGVRSWATRRSFVTLGIAVVLGTCGLYYALFTVLLLLLAAVLAGLGRRGAHALGALTAAAAIVITVLITLTPNIAYRLEHGTNPSVAHRVPFESEVYATKLTNLVLPLSGDRIGVLRRIRTHYDSTAPPPADYGTSLGLIGAVGVATMLATILFAALPAGRGIDLRLRVVSVAGTFSILVITVGGISSLIAYLVTPEIRAWYRDAIFVAFFALFAVALLIDRLVGAHRRLVVAVSAVLVVFGVFEQTTNAFVPPYAALRSEYVSDAALVARIEQRLPRGAAVFELPYVAFPEAASVGTADVYSGARGYLHSNDLRWSWGSMEGRPEDWQEALQGAPIDVVLPAVAAAGFQGLWLNRDGYPGLWPKLEAHIMKISGARPIVSPNAHVAFFDLRRFSRGLRLRLGADRFRALGRSTLHPVTTSWSPSFYAPDLTLGGNIRWSAAPYAELTLRSPRDRVDGAFTVRVRSRRPVTLNVSWPDGEASRVRVGPGITTLHHRVTLPAGRDVSITFSTPARAVRDPSDGRVEYFGLINAAFTGRRLGQP